MARLVVALMVQEQMHYSMAHRTLPFPLQEILCCLLKEKEIESGN